MTFFASPSVRALALLVTTATAACSAAPAVEDESESDELVSSSAPTNFDAAVLLLVDRDEPTPGICTGSIIAANVVLTARHCIDVGHRNDEGCLVGGKLLDASNVTVKIGQAARSSNVVAAKGKRVHVAPNQGACNPDLAILELDRPITNVAPVALADKPPSVGALCTSVGYAAPLRRDADEESWPEWEAESESTSTDDEPPGFAGDVPQGVDEEEVPGSPSGPPLIATYPRGVRSGLKLLAVGATSAAYDDATGKRNEYRVRADELATGEAICGGDSGGPLFDERGRQVGVAIRKPPTSNGKCIGTPSIYKSVAAHASWIRAKLNELAR